MSRVCKYQRPSWSVSQLCNFAGQDTSSTTQGTEMAYSACWRGSAGWAWECVGDMLYELDADAPRFALQ